MKTISPESQFPPANSQGLHLKTIALRDDCQDFTYVYTLVLTFDSSICCYFLFNADDHTVIGDNLDCVAWFQAVIGYPCLWQCDSYASLTYPEKYPLHKYWHQLDLSNMASLHLCHFLS